MAELRLNGKWYVGESIQVTKEGVIVDGVLQPDTNLNNGECLAYKCYNRSLTPVGYCLDHSPTTPPIDDTNELDQAVDKLLRIFKIDKRPITTENLVARDEAKALLAHITAKAGTQARIEAFEELLEWQDQEQDLDNRPIGSPYYLIPEAARDVIELEVKTLKAQAQKEKP